MEVGTKSHCQQDKIKESEVQQELIAPHNIILQSRQTLRQYSSITAQ